MNNLFKSKDYSWSLFVGHLVIEKLLKACYVSVKGKHPPLIHNLLKLAQKAQLNIPDETQEVLDVITTFNISSRYDDYRQQFYKRCTKEFTAKWIGEIKAIRKWIKEKQLA
jgi:HEPN domain-containing protein